MSDKLEWKVNTPKLIEELLNHSGSGAVLIPLKIFRNLLTQVAIRATELNDPKLNSLMCRLALYSISDPYDKEYDKDLTNQIIDEVMK